jgi:hypothetical protein
LIRDYCLRFLKISTNKDFLPLFFPLQLLPLNTTEVEQAFREGEKLDAWDLLMRTWCKFAQDLVTQERLQRQLPNFSITREWLYSVLHQRPCLLVFDSIDEFFDRHQNVIEVADLRSTVNTAFSYKSGFGLNPSIRLLQFVRETLPDCKTLAPINFHYCLREPTETEASEIFPSLPEKLKRIPESLRQIVISPLLLPTLGRHLEDISDKRLQSQSTIYEEALLWLIRDSKLTKNFANVSEQQFCDALALIAWDYYVSRDYILTFQLIQSRALKRLEWWSDQPAIKVSQKVKARRAQLRQLVKIFTTSEILQSILQRTIFFKVSDYPELNGALQIGRTYRMQHENWTQQLGGRYLADCIWALQPIELSFGPCTSYMFSIAGETLLKNGSEITSDIVTLFLCKHEDNPYISGNFIATLASSEIAIDDPAAAIIVRDIATLTGISQIVLAAGLGWRILRNSPTDQGLNMLKKHFIPAFERILKASDQNSLCSVTQSLAWCVLRQLGKASDVPWPRLWDGYEGKEDNIAKRIICDPSTNPPTITPIHRALQRAFIEIQETDKNDEARPISLVHYLYFLALAYKLNGATAAVDACLRRSQVLEKYTSSSDLIIGPIADACRRLAGLPSVIPEMTQ